MWHKIYFNVQSIQGETDKAYLVKMPNNCTYAGYHFWISKKLVWEQGGKGWHLSMSINETFTYVLNKYGRGRYNRRDVISSVTVTSMQMLSLWGVVNESVQDSIEAETDKLIQKEIEMELTPDIEITRHIPERVEPVITEPEKSLLKNDR